MGRGMRAESAYLKQIALFLLTLTISACENSVFRNLLESLVEGESETSAAEGPGSIEPAILLPKTGQLMCYDSAGINIACFGTGQDGDLQKGVVWPPGGTLFNDNGDGTITHNLTGLIWLKDANFFGLRDWSQALGDSNILADGTAGLTDGSQAGDWRLPNRDELRSLIDYGDADNAVNRVLSVSVRSRDFFVGYGS